MLRIWAISGAAPAQFVPCFQSFKIKRRLQSIGQIICQFVVFLYNELWHTQTEKGITRILPLIFVSCLLTNEEVGHHSFPRKLLFEFCQAQSNCNAVGGTELAFTSTFTHPPLPGKVLS